jgi:hypothetical protein
MNSILKKPTNKEIVSGIRTVGMSVAFPRALSPHLPLKTHWRRRSKQQPDK